MIQIYILTTEYGLGTIFCMQIYLSLRLGLKAPEFSELRMQNASGDAPGFEMQDFLILRIVEESPPS